MINFLHTFTPDPVLISLGPLNVYWYGIFIVSGIIAAIQVVMRVAKRHQISQETVIDIVFWVLISGVIGARLYHVALELPFYLEHPLNIIKLWQGGLAIHGGLIGGLIAAAVFCYRRRLDYRLLLAIFVPGLALGQAIGRWGNYFNQELFGRPTDLPWGILIDPANRPFQFSYFQHFHPTFLYESLGNLIIFGVLLYLHIWILKNRSRGETSVNRALRFMIIVISYLSMYSLLRFGLEFIRIDITPVVFGLRWPQWISILIILFNSIYMYTKWPKFKELLKT